MENRMKKIPKVLTNSFGKSIVSKEQWEQERRPEIVDLFKEYVYGVNSIERPENMNFEVEGVQEMMDGKALRKIVNITYKGIGGKGNIKLVLFIPVNISKPVPIFLLANNRNPNNIDPDRNIKSSFWPAENIIAHGYGAAAFSVEDVGPDNYDGFKDGVHGIFDSPNKERPDNAWGTIAAWAWGASRVMDYFETDNFIDDKRVALVGHSRGGKTALWCGAQDERFAMVVSNNSGCTGAAITRGKQGETVKIINKSFPHWFNKNYKKYSDDEENLPVDQHMLLSLIAPRLLYVTSASEDTWADPESEFLSCILAKPVYELYGFKGLGVDIMPCCDSPIYGEHIAYHIRTGKHDLTEYDWECFIDYADKYMK